MAAYVSQLVGEVAVAQRRHTFGGLIKTHLAASLHASPKQCWRTGGLPPYWDLLPGTLYMPIDAMFLEKLVL